VKKQPCARSYQCRCRQHYDFRTALSPRSVFRTTTSSTISFQVRLETSIFWFGSARRENKVHENPRHQADRLHKGTGLVHLLDLLDLHAPSFELQATDRRYRGAFLPALRINNASVTSSSWFFFFDFVGVFINANVGARLRPRFPVDGRSNGEFLSQKIAQDANVLDPSAGSVLIRERNVLSAKEMR